MAIITDIKETKRKDGRIVELYAGDEMLGYFYKESLEKCAVRVGQILDNELLVDLAFANSYIEVEDLLTSNIKRFPKSERKCREFLTGKGYASDIVNKVVDRLVLDGVIDDCDYIRKYIKYYRDYEGDTKIKNELINKGFSVVDIDEALSVKFDCEDTILRLTKKYMKNRQLNNTNRYKLYKYLVGKGFDIASVKQSVNNYGAWENNDWL